MEESRAQRNPFFNHLIISKVVSYTNRITDLTSLRLVSLQWNSLTTQKLLKNSVVTFKSQKDVDMYLKHFDFTTPHNNFHWKGTGIDLSDPLLNCVLKSSAAEELHFSKGLITLDDLKSILKCGKSLKTLSFNEVCIEQEEEISAEDPIKMHDDTKETDETSNFATNLNRLEITACDEDDNFPWKVVLPKLPHLRTLHAQLHSSNQVTTLLECMLENQMKLVEFSCFLVDMNDEHLQLLSCLQMPLKVLDISLASSVSHSTVEAFLASSSCRGLENLKLFKEADCGHKNYFCLPKMLSLKSLEVLGDPVAKIFNTIHGSCPNLESLNLSEVSCRDVMSQKSQHFQLRSLCIEECFFPTNVLVKLAEAFPKMSKLCLFLNDDNVGTVFKKFESLEELTILGTEISDEGITGGRQHELNNGSRGNERPFIGDCSQLRVLNLYPQPLPGITDASIYQGVLFVPELTSVCAPETAISNKALRTLLRVRPNLVKLVAKVMIDSSTNEHFLRSTKYQLL